MAKHPVPKRRLSKARGKTRHSAWRNNLAKYWEDKAQVVKCDCGSAMLAHNVCEACGKYRGKEVIKKKGDDNIKVVKA